MIKIRPQGPQIDDSSKMKAYKWPQSSKIDFRSKYQNLSFRFQIEQKYDPETRNSRFMVKKYKFRQSITKKQPKYP